MNTAESKYTENKAYLSRCAREWTLRLQESGTRSSVEFAREDEWLRCAKGDFPKYVPFLTVHSGVEFRGRILEIGAGVAWLSAELSKQPRVVEITATDSSPKLLKEQAPKVFKMLDANAAKITRMQIGR